MQPNKADHSSIAEGRGLSEGTEFADRASTRRKIRLRTTTNLRSGADHDVLVHDISAGGMLIETEADVLMNGDCFEVSLPETDRVNAEVVWQSGQFSGCKFVDSLTTGVVSAALLKAEPEQKFPEALPSRSAARLEPELNLAVPALISLLMWAAIATGILLFA